MKLSPKERQQKFKDKIGDVQKRQIESKLGTDAVKAIESAYAKEKTLKKQVEYSPASRRLIEMTDSTINANPEAFDKSYSLPQFIKNSTGNDVEYDNNMGYTKVKGQLLKLPMVKDESGNLLLNKDGKPVGIGGMPLTPVNKASDSEYVRAYEASDKNTANKWYVQKRKREAILQNKEFNTPAKLIENLSTVPEQEQEKNSVTPTKLNPKVKILPKRK